MKYRLGKTFRQREAFAVTKLTSYFQLKLSGSDPHLLNPDMPAFRQALRPGAVRGTQESACPLSLRSTKHPSYPSAAQWCLQLELATSEQGTWIHSLGHGLTPGGSLRRIYRTADSYL